MVTTSRELAILDLIVHELRSPLSVAAGSFQQVSDAVLTDAQKSAAERVSRALENLTALTDQLRAWSRIGDAHPRTAVNVATAIASALDSPDARKRHIDFAASEVPTDVQIMSVRERFIPALGSIVAAVVRSAANRATVRVDIKVDPAEVRIAVGDLQEGQESDFPAEFVGGLGVTLPLARAAIESDGGHIWSNSVDGRVAGIGFVLPRA